MPRNLLFIALIVAAVLLSGCAGWDARLASTIERASELNDRALLDAEFVICRGASKGSIDRRYGQNSETAWIYAEFCRLVTNGVVNPGPDSQIAPRIPNQRPPDQASLKMEQSK